MASVAAASVGPVLPADTSASARPSATAAAAWTIEASGFERTARTGLSAAGTAGASTTPSPAGISAAGPNTSAGSPDRRAPSATTAGPPSAPFASTAITEAEPAGYSSSVSSTAGRKISRPA